MGETMTYGPRVTYTYTCAVCGEKHEGLHNCEALRDKAAALTWLGSINARAYLVAYQGNEPEPLRMGMAALAVAAEVLSDPRGYARALGLPDPPGMAESVPVAGLG